MGSHGHRVDFDAAHSQATGFNELARLGTVGTVFHAWCLLETTTNAFHIRMLPSAPASAGAVWSGLDFALVCRPVESVPIPTGAVHAKHRQAVAGADRIPPGHPTGKGVIVHALQPHAASSAEAAKCAMYIFHKDRKSVV